MTEHGTEDTLASGGSQPSATKLPATPGAVAVAGTERYQRGRELGRGGMGRVVEALDLQFNRVVAIKELINSGSDQRRFATEAHVTGNLEHPGIPSVYERGVDDRGLPFYAMRKVQGRTLGAILSDARTLADRLALLPAVVKTAQTLGYAHEHGVIHRDVKPENVIVGPYGDVVLLDWGVARVKALGADSGPGTAALPSGTASSTVHGAVVGTPAYMSPEQASGHNDAIDERTDVFAVGALLHHLLTGRPPYAGTTIDEVLGQARSGQITRIATATPDAPPALVAIAARAMAKQPAERYRTATEVARALEEFQSSAVLSTPSSRVLGAAVNVAIGFAVVLTGLAAIGLFAMLPTFFHLGFIAYFTVAMAVVGTFLSALEWKTRGRYVLSSMAFGFAMATLCAAFAGGSLAMAAVFARLQQLGTQPDEYRQLLAAGGWESIGAITLGVVCASGQFLLWGIANRRARLAQLS